MFSWTEVELLKLDVRNFIITQEKLDLVSIVEYLSSNVKTKFIRKPFADFSYLTVEPPLWIVLLIYATIISVCAGISAWIVHNEFE